MPKTSKNKFSVNGDTVSITKEEWDSAALATFREDYYEEMSSHTWGLNKGYPINATLGGGLHRYMMKKWYGEDVLKAFTDKGYVVDHMNNNHMDSRICNLEFLKNNRNIAKGHYQDKESEQLRHRIAVSIFKDFSTGRYQITVGCNDNIVRKEANGEVHYINSIKLLYNCNYSLVILDAEALLTQYEADGQINLNHLRSCDIKIQYAPNIQLTEEEKNKPL